jgi:phosphoglycerol transferase MdoB-like AlkP superfamily enzyme
MSEITYAIYFGVFNYHLKDIVESINTGRKMQLSKTELYEISKYFEHKKKLNETSSPFYGIAKGRNVFLIHLESLHPFLVDLELDGMQVIPTLNKLRKDSFFWGTLLDQSARGGSSDSEFSALTGLLPDTKKIAAMELLSGVSLRSLPKTLKENGYKTVTFHGNSSSYWNRYINHRLYGIDNLVFKDSFSSNNILGFGVPDKDFFLETVDMISNYKELFFAYMITLSSHHPFKKIPKGYIEYFSESVPPETVLAGYLKLERYMDDCLGLFFDKMKENGLYYNSIFVLYGDHRPGVGIESDKILKNLTGTPFRSLRGARVPLFIFIPGKEKHINSFKKEYQSTIGGLYDIYPTVLHLLGIDIPYGIFGTHLFVSNSKRDAVPALRLPMGFVSNTILYQGMEGTPIKDEQGYVYNFHGRSLLPEGKTRKDKWVEAYKALRMHNFIFYGDAQQKAIQSYRRKTQTTLSNRATDSM